MSPPESPFRRHSTPSRLLTEPGPDASQIRQLLERAVCVPDHGQLVPWRFLSIQGQARHDLGQLLAARALELNPLAAAAVVEKDRRRFSHAPLIIAVIARLTAGHKIPEQEQLLSGGAVCLSLLQAADDLGFGAQWLTGWAAYDPVVTSRLGLADNERILGFVHIGTARDRPNERQRPDASALLTDLKL